jgi:hypothetical protein
MHQSPLAATIGDLLASETLSLEEVKRSASAIFDGENTLPVTHEVAIHLPAFANLPEDVRAAIVSALMAGRPVRR